jgi:hypothetical protein
LLAQERIIYTKVEISVYLVVEECTKKTLCENLTKKRAKNLELFLCHKHSLLAPPSPLALTADGQAYSNAEQELKLSCFYFSEHNFFRVHIFQLGEVIRSAGLKAFLCFHRC